MEHCPRCGYGAKLEDRYEQAETVDDDLLEPCASCEHGGKDEDEMPCARCSRHPRLPENSK